MKLTNEARLARMAIAAVLALLFAGSAMAVAASAMELAFPAASLVLAALAGVGLCVVGGLSGGAVFAALGFALVAGLYVAAHSGDLGALRALFDGWAGREADAELAARGGGMLLTCAGFALGALFFSLLNHRESVSLAVALELAALVFCHAASAGASLGATIPGLIAAAAAFALTGGVQRDLSALRALIPAGLAVALALALLPVGRVTWPPLEEAAQRVRGVFEQYFRFTRERIAFSINEEGYDHAGEVGDSVVAMLGGPAHPHTDPVMRVDTDAAVLLRGSIRTAYTGWSWVDAAPKNRYLYYDLTHRSTRDRVFAPAEALEGALRSAEVTVELLDDGTSTLFVPGLMERFSMDLSTAVYYNTAGEMFLSREVRPGDAYRLRALLPEPGEALRQAVLLGESADDDRYSEILDLHTRLPEGIDGGVYALTVQVIGEADTPYDRATAIMDYLRSNMRYTLEAEYPPRGRDFVSHFLLDTRQGYCSYYATAMAVMGRIAGLPTRYVEGFLARPGRETLTGEDAHAWAEVYFRGVGWIPFDATGGATGSGSGAGDPDSGGDGNGDSSGEQSDAPSEGDYDGPEATPEPQPEGGAEEPDAAPEPEPLDEPSTQSPGPEAEPELPPEPDETGRRDAPSGLWWILAIALLLALAALGARWVRKRLRASDPERLCEEMKGSRRAALMLYRANLTALAHLGQFPGGGEAPESFAGRVAGQLKNPDYAEFVRAVAEASYGKRALRRADVEAGLRAYAAFRSAMSRRERLRFAATRILRGLGDFDSIP